MDERLRQLERRLRGGDADAAALLRERLRAGQVTARDLGLAAWLGSRDARAVLNEASLPAPADEQLGAAWVDGLREWGMTLPLRAALAAASAASFVFAAERPGDLRPSQALARAQRTLDALERGEASQEDLLAMHESAAGSSEAAYAAGSGPACWAAQAACAVAVALASLGETSTPGRIGRGRIPHAWSAIDAAARALGGPAPARAAIAAVLLPPLLREGWETP